MGEFIVQLPLTTDESSAQKTSGAETPVARSSKRTLVVDDNRDGADLLASLLEALGNVVRVAYDGETAVTASAEYRPHVVLLDLGLPKLNGYEACRRIRAQPGGEQRMIIAQTGWGQAEDHERTREAGFDHHLVKPIDPDVLGRLLGGLSV